MRVRTVYICEFCEKEYNNPENARKCEEKHEFERSQFATDIPPLVFCDNCKRELQKNSTVSMDEKYFCPACYLGIKTFQKYFSV